MKIDEIKFCERYRRDLGDLGPLAKSMDEVGLLHPIVVNSNGELIAGARRVNAAFLLGWEEISASVIDIDVLLGQHVENNMRKDFTASERVAIGLAFEERIGGRQGQRTDKGLPQELAEVGARNGMETREVAAKYAGFGSRETYRLAEFVTENGDAELVALMDAEECSINLAAKIAQKDEHYQKAVIEKVKEGNSSIDAKRAVDQELRLENIERTLPPHKPMLAHSFGRPFQLIYANLPWHYEDSPMHSSNGLFDRDDSEYDSIEYDNPDAQMEKFCALGDDVRKLAPGDSLLFMWAPPGKLAQCLSVLDAWGFYYETNLVWVKDQIGTGYYARNQHELLLMGCLGAIDPPPLEARIPSVITAPCGANGEKPDVVYEIIEACYPTLAKIELFTPNHRDGWASSEVLS